MPQLWSYFTVVIMAMEIIIGFFKKIELPLTVNTGLCGLILLLQTINVVNISSTYFGIIMVYSALNLIAAPFSLKKRFVTPNIVAPKCPFCGGYMIATKLKCENCGKTTGE